MVFSTCRPSTLARSKAARLVSAWRLVAALARAICAEAALAWLPRVFISSVVLLAFIAAFSHP